MRFQVGINKQTGRNIAVKVVSVRQRVRARVESVKGQVNVSFFALLHALFFLRRRFPAVRFAYKGAFAKIHKTEGKGACLS